MSLKIPHLSEATADALLHDFVVTQRSRWSVIKASGATVRDYLQGQITQDMAKLTPTQGIHACLLTPQGKAITELYIFEGHHCELILLTPASHAVATVGRLRQFALGHQLRIGVVDALAVCAAQGANAAELLNSFDLAEPEGNWLSSSRHSCEESFTVVMPERPRGFWIISSSEKIIQLLTQHKTADENEFEAMRIMRGFPDFGVEWDESTHPLNANLIEFDGVSFDKGCYVGQEVTARMNWRGGIKKKLYRVAIDGRPTTLPCPVLTSSKIGELKSAAIDHESNCIGIALLPIEIAESDATLALDDGSIVKILEACHA